MFSYSSFFDSVSEMLFLIVSSIIINRASLPLKNKYGTWQARMTMKKNYMM